MKRLLFGLFVLCLTGCATSIELMGGSSIYVRNAPSVRGCTLDIVNSSPRIGTVSVQGVPVGTMEPWEEIPINLRATYINWATSHRVVVTVRIYTDEGVATFSRTFSVSNTRNSAYHWEITERMVRDKLLYSH